MTGFPHDKIREDEDRSYTFALLERFVKPGIPEDEVYEIADTLERLDDPRAESRLARILEDRALPQHVRGAAGVVLRSCSAIDQRKLPAMLREGDVVLQRHAVLAMDHRYGDFIESIARNPGHPLYHEAIRSMATGFQEPRFQALKIAALAHPDPSVRETAANVLLWDEPVLAEEPLLRCLDDVDERVVVAAANTLQYYPTRRSLARLAEMSARGGKPGEQADYSFSDLSVDFQSGIEYAKGPERDELIEWMQPVWSILAFTDEDIAPKTRESSGPITPVYDVVTMAELLESLADPDGLWAEKKRRLQRTDPAAFSPAEIERLALFLVTHPDPEVRADGARLLAAWDRYEELFQLLDDWRFGVMKSAMYYFGLTHPSPAVAERAFRHLFEPGVASTHAYESLETYVAHAPATEAILRLFDLAQHDERESIRVHAVYALKRLGAAREIESLLPQLEEPPLMTWAVHIALLEACCELGIPPRGHEALRDVDNLYLHRAIVKLANKPRS